MTINDILKDLRADCSCEDAEYCPAEAFLRSFPPRVIEQHKCVEMLKFMESRAVGMDIGWERAYELWEEGGYAKKFAEVYQEGMKHRELFLGITGVQVLTNGGVR